MRGFDTRRPQNHCWDVWGHTAHAVDAIAPESVLRLTMLFHDSGKRRRSGMTHRPDSAASPAIRR